MPSITGGHHIALTVTDADRSAEWCSGLLRRAALEQWEREQSARGIGRWSCFEIPTTSSSSS